MNRPKLEHAEIIWFRYKEIHVEIRKNAENCH